MQMSKAVISFTNTSCTADRCPLVQSMQCWTDYECKVELLQKMDTSAHEFIWPQAECSSAFHKGRQLLLLTGGASIVTNSGQEQAAEHTQMKATKPE